MADQFYETVRYAARVAARDSTQGIGNLRDKVRLDTLYAVWGGMEVLQHRRAGDRQTFYRRLIDHDELYKGISGRVIFCWKTLPVMRGS